MNMNLPSVQSKLIWRTIPALLLCAALLTGCGVAKGDNAAGGKEDDQVDIRGIVQNVQIVIHEDNAVEEENNEEIDPNTPFSNDDPESPRKPPKELLGSILVQGQIEPDTTHDYASITIKDSTAFFKKAGDTLEPASFADVKEGSKVEVAFNGPVAESYPVQTTAGKVVILELIEQ